MGETSWKQYYRTVYPDYWKTAAQSETDEYHCILLDLIAPRAGQRVLECGIGTGEPLALEAARRGASVFGLDIAWPLLRICRSKFAQQGLAVECQLGDIENLPYASGSFDTIYAVSTTWYLPNLPQALAEMSRVLRAGGRLVFDVINYLHPSQFIMYQYSKVYNIGKFLVKKVRGQNAQWYGLVQSRARTPMQINAMLKRLGLEFQVKGFFVLLPLYLPLLHYKANLCRYSPRFSFGLQDHPWWKYWGGKLVYICQKQKEPSTS